MSKRKNPRGFRGSRSTNHSAKGLCKGWYGGLKAPVHANRDEVLAAWPNVVGPKFALMSEAVGFEDGTLKIRVKNSTLYTLFVQYEKERLLSALKAKFPAVENIDFKMG